MSISPRNEIRSDLDNLESSSNNSNNLWSEIYSTEKYQNISTKDDSFIKNNNSNNNQLLLIQEPKSILDSKFYLIKKIGEGSSGKVYLGIHKDDLNYLII